jgi:hypothetical protein
MDRTPRWRAMTSPILRPTLRAHVVGILALLVAALPVPGLAQGGTLFPEPFVVEHRLIQSGDGGGLFESDPVTDYYGGSWIVSVRADGSRTVVDLARREVTEIHPEEGTYSTIGFDRLGELTERAARAQKRARVPEREDGTEEARLATRAERHELPELVVQELPPESALATRSAGAASRAAAPGVLRLRVVEEERITEERAGMEVWVDPSVRMRPAALDALSSFESALAGGGSGAAERASVTRHVATARRHAAGAVAVRTVRHVGKPGSDTPIRVEDVTTRLEALDDFPEELVAVPEGLRRVPHPLEGMVAFLEAEAERERAMAGEGRERP